MKTFVNIFNELNDSETESIQIKKKVFMEGSNVRVEEAAPIDTSKEDRLASLKTQLEKDGDQLADDEKKAIEDEIASIEKELEEGCDKSLKEDDYEMARPWSTALIRHCENYDADIVWEETLKSLVKFLPDDRIKEFCKSEFQVLSPEEIDSEDEIEEGCNKSLKEDDDSLEFKVGDIVKVPYKYGSYTPGEFTEAPIIDIENGKHITVEIPSKLVVYIDQLRKWNNSQENIEESNLTEGFSLDKAQILDTCERRGQPIALVNLSPIKDWKEYVVAFGYTTENNEVSWDYGYYYYDEESAKKAFEKVKAGGNLSESALNEKYVETFGGDSEDFVNDVTTIKSTLEGIDTNSFGTKLAQQMVWDWIETCDYQIEKGNRLTKGEFNESEKVVTEAKEKPIVEAAETEVKDLQVIKEQGNVYMLEDKSEGTRYIVGENYNLSEGEIENAEIYDSKEEADKDYLDRCEVIKDGEEFNPKEDSSESEETIKE